MDSITQPDRPITCKRHGIAAITSWHHTVEHIDTQRNAEHQIQGCADAHQIARPVLRQLAGGEIEGGEHRLLPLANGQTADGIAVEADIGQRLG